MYIQIGEQLRCVYTVNMYKNNDKQKHQCLYIHKLILNVYVKDHKPKVGGYVQYIHIYLQNCYGNC